MTRRRQLKDEQNARLRAAEHAAEDVAARGAVVDTQVSLVDRLADGWNRVHEFNHLAELFRPTGGSS